MIIESTLSLMLVASHPAHMLVASDAVPPPGTSVRDIIAGAVLDHGLPCSQPLEAVRDETCSRPDEACWLLRCSEGRYRVTFKGDNGSVVVPLK